MNRYLHIFAALFLPLLLPAQVEIGTEIRLTGEPGQRNVQGLAPATSPSSAITVEASLLGGTHWAEATYVDQTITLTQNIPVEEYRPGILLRFIWPVDMHGEILLQTSGLASLPLLRSDGLEPVPGQLTQGVIAEVVHAQDRWVLLSPTERGCPPGSLPVHAGLCMDATSSPNVFVYDAMDQCQAKGGKLCTWDEYYLACTLLEGQLTTYSAWEWLDDTSNHTHTGDQGGRYTCRSQRSVNPVLTQGRVRCCYYPR